jgi:hypothetical protein
MIRQDSHTAQNRGLMAALLALVLFARLIVPAGFMPAEQNGPTFVLCTGEGTITGWIGADGTVHKEQDKQKTNRDAPCAFAGIGASLLGTAPVIAMIAITVALPLADGLAASATVGRGLAAPPPPQTGPPPQP